MKLNNNTVYIVQTAKQWALITMNIINFDNVETTVLERNKILSSISLGFIVGKMYIECPTKIYIISIAISSEIIRIIKCSLTSNFQIYLSDF